MVELPGFMVRGIAQFHGMGGFKLPVSVTETDKVLMILWQNAQLVATCGTSADVAGHGRYRHENSHDEKQLFHCKGLIGKSITVSAIRNE